LKKLDRKVAFVDNSGMPKPRTLAAAILVPVVVGSIVLINLTHQPRFEMFHTVDVLQLLASGACFGLALAALLAMLRGTRGA
jgi:predicted membrane protein